jgi:hypothetical protein
MYQDEASPRYAIPPAIEGMPVLGTRAVCAELRKALDKRANARTVDSQPYYGWSYAYPSGGLIQKYLSAQIGIAFRRVEGPARNAKQRGFILRVGMLHDPLDHVNLRDVGFRWDRLNVNQSLVLPQIIQFSDVPDKMVPARESVAVGFCSFDNLSFDGGEAMFGFQFLYGSQKISGLFGDGEIGCSAGYCSVARDDCRNQKIECGPDGVDNCSNVTDDERIERLFKIGDKQFPIRLLRLRLNDDAVWATTIPFDESLLQDWDLGLGPLDWD